MPTYDIKEWHSILVGNNNEPFPMIYVKADDNLLNYAKQNDYSFQVTIQNSESLYDAMPIIGIMEDSGCFPDYRPNFFNDTGFITIVLMGSWIGYPPKNGQVFVQGLIGEDRLQNLGPKPFDTPKPMKYGPWEFFSSKRREKNSFSDEQIQSIFLFLFIIFGILFFTSFCTYNQSSRKIRS